MGLIKHKQPIYEDGRTKQSFKDETDINNILQRAQKAGTLSHLQKYEAVYGDYSDFDFFESELKLAQGRQIFDALPSELRTEFNQSPQAFFAYVNNPANKDELLKKLPQLAAPGRQVVDVSGKSAPADASEPQASGNQLPQGQGAAAPQNAPASSEAAPQTPPASPPGVGSVPST